MKNIKINEQTHKKLTKHCKDNGLVLYTLVEKIVKDYLEGVKNENNTNR